MGSTPNWDIYYYSNGDPGSEITESAVQAGTIETALDQVGGDIGSVNNFGVRYFANASARDLALTSPSVGWLTQLDSELFVRRWDGTKWVPFGSGEFPLKPASVSGNNVSLDSTGVVQWSGSGGGAAGDAFSVNVDGVASDEFRRFRVEWTVSAWSNAASSLGLRLRSGGVTYSATGYNFVRTTASGTTIPVASNTVNYAVLAPSMTQGGTGSFTLDNARSTSGDKLIKAEAFTAQFSGGIVPVYATSGTHCATTAAVDGFQLRPTVDADTWSGTLRVYGLI